MPATPKDTGAKRIASYIKEYAEQRSNNKFVDVAELRARFHQAQTMIAQLTQHISASGKMEITTVAPQSYPATQAQSNEDYERVNLTTWDAVVTAAMSLASEKYKGAITTHRRIAAAVLRPAVLTQRDLTEDGVEIALLQPYLDHFFTMKDSLRALQHQASAEADQVTTTQQRVTNVTTIFVSKWLQDFLYVFKRAHAIGVSPYPAARSLEGVLYSTRVLHLVTEDRQTVRKEVTTYALDLGHQWATFGGMFTSIGFSPTTDLPMKPEMYADFELLIHYSLRAFEQGQHYAQFVKDPGSFLQGHQAKTLNHALAQAASVIMDATRDRQLFFRATNKGDVELVRKVTSPDGNVMVDGNQPVPEMIMAHLAVDILKNRVLYERRRAGAVYMGTDNAEVQDVRLESPIARLLNFDERAVAEFRALYKTLPESAREHYNSQLSDQVPRFKCVHRVLMMLTSAAAAMYALRAGRHLEPTFVLSRCTKYDTARDSVLYAPTTQAFPGLLTYTMLAAQARPDTFQVVDRVSATDTEDKPGLSHSAYFADRPDRVAFFDAFGAYATQLEGMAELSKQLAGDAETGIRWMKPEIIAGIRASKGQTIAQVQAAYTSLLANLAITNWTEQSNPKLSLAYLMKDGYDSKDEQSISHLTPNSKAQYADKRQFFNLPILYAARSEMTATPKQQKKKSASFSYSVQLQDIVQELANNQTQSTREDQGVLRLLV